jgi:phage portal protein BeeE
MMTTGDKVATFASSGNFSQDFVTYCLQPLAVAAEKEGRRSLLAKEEKDLNYYIKFQMGALLRGSFKEQMESFQIAINEEIMNPNECRDLLDMNPYQGGDEYRTRTSTVKQPAQPAKGAQQ